LRTRPIPLASRRLPVIRACALLATLLLLVPVQSRAQGIQPRGFELWGGYYTWSGDDFENVDPGLRGGLAFLVEAAPTVGVGGEVVVARFDENGEDVTEFGLNALLRWSLGPLDSFHGFVQGRVGWSRLSAASVTWDGLAVGPELGVELPLSERIRLVVAAGGSWHTYQDAEVDFGTGGGPGIPGSSTSGIDYGARVGLAIGDVF
jgi:hypothetical protein